MFKDEYRKKMALGMLLRLQMIQELQDQQL